MKNLQRWKQQPAGCFVFNSQQLAFSFPPVDYYSINASNEKMRRSSLLCEFELTVQKLEVFNKFLAKLINTFQLNSVLFLLFLLEIHQRQIITSFPLSMSNSKLHRNRQLRWRLKRKVKNNAGLPQTRLWWKPLIEIHLWKTCISA